jgi:hypothetical protein
MNSRNSILHGQKPNASHLSALGQTDTTLRSVCYYPFNLHIQQGRIVCPLGRRLMSCVTLGTLANDDMIGTFRHDRRLR